MGALLAEVSRWAVDVVDSFGYPGVFVIVALGSALDFPLPTEFTLPFIGFLIGQGRLSFVPALLVSAVARVAVSLALYYLGMRIGKERLRRLLKLVERFGLLSRLDLDRASGLFERHGGEAVLVGQLLPGVGGWISVPAGLERMPIRWRFIGYTIMGSALWSGSLIALGWALGTRWKMVDLYVSIIGYVVLCVVVFGIIWSLWRRWRVWR
jgi:membrane protein DedA with SNARE-associated domain